MIEAYPMHDRAPKQFLAWLASLALLACNSVTHTVGQLEDEAEIGPAPGSIGRPPSGRAGSGASAGTGGGGSGSGGAFAPGGLDGSFNCGAGPLPATRKPLELYLMIDSNINLPFSNPWTTLLAGIRNYVGDERAAGTGVAVDYFELELDPNLCSPGRYAQPTVAMAKLPENQAAIERSFARQLAVNTSPMQPALEGALTYSRSRANAYPDTVQAVVLISDGYEDFLCGTNDAELTQAAAEGYEQSPSVRTYVIAIDAPNLGDLLGPLGLVARFDPLEAVANAGGTGYARQTSLRDVDSAMVDTMLEIQHDAESCEYAVPDAVRDRVDRRLAVVADAGVPLALTEVPGPFECDGAGSYYANPDGAFVTLCPALCDQVKLERSEPIWFGDC